jgi:ATP-binding cassette subfamily B (MDR/TAP) protein 9
VLTRIHLLFLHLQMALGAAVASGSCELLLLLKAVAVAVWAPDMVMPSPSLPGVSGLLCTFVAITTSICSSLVTGLVIRWLIHRRGTPASSKTDEESPGSEVTRPLLAASWEVPENNKSVGQSADKGSEEAEQKTLQPGTVLELVRMTVPDMPVLLFAFLFGVAAALMAACVPYFTGLIIDYASIDPDRCVMIEQVLEVQKRDPYIPVLSQHYLQGHMNVWLSCLYAGT